MHLRLNQSTMFKLESGIRLFHKNWSSLYITLYTSIVPFFSLKTQQIHSQLVFKIECYGVFILMGSGLNFILCTLFYSLYKISCCIYYHMKYNCMVYSLLNVLDKILWYAIPCLLQIGRCLYPLFYALEIILMYLLFYTSDRALYCLCSILLPQFTCLYFTLFMI